MSMFDLTPEQVRLLLDRLGEDTVQEPTEAFPYRISRQRSFGYSDDPKISQIQVKLSMLLEAKLRAGT